MSLSVQERAAHHEAGHIVAYIYYGWPVKSANINQFEREDHMGMVCGQTFTGDPPSQMAEADVRRSSIVSIMCGPLAAQRACGELPGSITMDFREDAEAILAQVSQISTDYATCQLIARDALRIAHQVVGENWKAITAVAARLIADKEVTGDVLQAICKEHGVKVEPQATPEGEPEEFEIRGKDGKVSTITLRPGIDFK